MKKFLQKFSRTESRIVGALSTLDDFLLNPQVRVQSGTFPGTSGDMNVENEEPTGDRSQNDPCPEVDAFVYQTAHPMDSDTQRRHPTCNLVLK